MTKAVRLAALFTAAVSAMLFTCSFAFASAADSGWEKKYKDEPYIELLSEESVVVNKDCSTTTRVHLVQKIQKEGARKLGEIPIQYDKSCEEVDDIEACTTGPDGKLLRCEKVQDLSSSGESSIYSDERMKVITMPGVVVGSVIDIRFTVRRNKPIIEKNFFGNFRFSSGCPIEEALYKVTVPKGMPLDIKVLNASAEPKVETDGDETVYSWDVRDTDKVEPEEWMPSGEEVYKYIYVSTLRDWRQLADWYWPLFKKNLKSSPEIKKKVEELAAGKATVSEKVQAVIEYIRSNVRYVAMNMDSHNYEPHPAGEIFRNKYGDCKDQTVLAITMLGELGVKAWPVLVSTYSELRRDDLLPMPSYFNHAILSLEVDGKQYYTDVLLKGYSFQVAPAAYEGKRAFVVNDQGGYFTVLPASDEDETAIHSREDVTIREDGSATVVTRLVFSRSASIGLREALKNMGQEKKEKFFAAMETAVISGGKLIDKSWSNLETPYALVGATISYETTCLVQLMGDMMVFGLPQLGRGSLFSAPKRNYPIVALSPSMTETLVTFTIPDGYEVTVLPKEVSLDGPQASFLRKYEVQGGHIIGKESMKKQRCRIPVSEYSKVQDFLDAITRKTNEKILIKKKG